MPLPNRLAIYLTGFGNLLAGLAPFIFDLDKSGRIAPYTGAILGMNAIVVTWLYNWGKWEERKDLEPLIEDQLAAANEAKVAKQPGPPPLRAK